MAKFRGRTDVSVGTDPAGVRTPGAGMAGATA